jgi:hypothetical protein
MNCLFCRKREANQTGSHILTSSLISHCINEPGKRGRNKELMFGISQDGETDLYVGREISIEKIEDVKGRDMTDEELQANNNELVIDNIYCRECEALFAKIENEFSKSLLGRLRNGEKDIEENILLRLYFLIQIWRLSTVKYNDWALEKDYEENLRETLYTACNSYPELSDEISERINSIPIIIHHLETEEGKESDNIVGVPDEINPYVFFLCDFILQLFPGGLPEELPSPHGINDGFGAEVIQVSEDTIVVNHISNAHRKSIVKSVFQGQAGPALKSYIGQFVKTATKNGIVISGELIAQFVRELVSEPDVQISERYSQERVKEVILRIINE